MQALVKGLWESAAPLPALPGAPGIVSRASPIRSLGRPPRQTAPPPPASAAFRSPPDPHLRPARPPLPLLSGGYGKGLGSDRERQLHPGGLQVQWCCGLQADPTTVPPASSHPRASAACSFKKGSALGGGRRRPRAESLTRERAALRALASFPGRRRVRPLWPTSRTAARDPTDRRRLHHVQQEIYSKCCM